MQTHAIILKTTLSPLIVFFKDPREASREKRGYYCRASQEWQ